MWTVERSQSKNYKYCLWWNGAEKLPYLKNGRQKGNYTYKKDAEIKAAALNNDNGVIEHLLEKECGGAGIESLYYGGRLKAKIVGFEAVGPKGNYTCYVSILYERKDKIHQVRIVRNPKKSKLSLYRDAHLIAQDYLYNCKY